MSIKPVTEKTIPNITATRRSSSSSVSNATKSNLIHTDLLTHQIQSYTSKFELRDFQKEAIKHLEQDQSVMVTAPTGAGKTVIAYAAMNKALREGKNFIYTAPLIAISEQKLEEFRAEVKRLMLEDKEFFRLDSLSDDEANKEADIRAKESVGMITGERKINPNAPLRIMTTEIYNLMSQERFLSPEAKTVAGRTVVFDEIHNLGSHDRGYAWEEGLMHTLPQDRIIGLSATIPNAGKVQEWINTKILTDKSNKMHLVQAQESDRPVQLQYFSFNQQATKQENMHVIPLDRAIEITEIAKKKAEKKATRNKAKPATSPKEEEREKFIDSMHGLVQELQKSKTGKGDKLPVLIFKLNRTDCDITAKSLADNDLKLLTQAERERVKQLVKEAIEKDPLLILEQEKGFISILEQGIAPHHAEHLQAYKNLVEKLFDEKLIKVVIATGTLAAGVNMPARTTVITELPGSVSEFKQMAGRAGRAGKDTQGNVVVFCDPGQEAEIKKKYIDSPSETINSSLSSNYLTLLNLITRLKSRNEIGFAEALRNYLSRTFKHTQGGGDIKSLGRQGKTLNQFLEEKKKDYDPILTILRDYKAMFDLLLEKNFISKDFELTDKGRVASHIKFGNPILITEFLYELPKFLKGYRKEFGHELNLSPQEFAALISCFSEREVLPESDGMKGFLTKLNHDYAKNRTDGKKINPLNWLIMQILQIASNLNSRSIEGNDNFLTYNNFLVVHNWTANGIENNRKDPIDDLRSVLKNNSPGRVIKALSRTLKLLEYLNKARKSGIQSFPASSGDALTTLLPERTDPLFARGVLAKSLAN